MTNPAPAQADVPFDGSGVQFYNPDTVASAVGNWIPFTIVAGKGHWPIGKIPVLSTTGGAATGAVLQFDQIVTDNPASPASYLMATGKFLATDAFDAAGGAVPIRSYKWVLANGNLTTTPAFTLANVTANTDVKLNLYDGDLGGTAAAPTYFVGLNYCIANFPAHSSKWTIDNAKWPISFGCTVSMF